MRPKSASGNRFSPKIRNITIIFSILAFFLSLISVTGDTTVYPGTSPGILTAEGDYTMGAATTLSVELYGDAPGTEYDQLAVTGAVTLAPGVTLVLNVGGSARRNDVFTVIDGASLSGIFNYGGQPLNDLDEFGFQSWVFQIDYDEPAGDVMIIVLIPEPATLALAGLAVAGLMLRRRRPSGQTPVS